LPIVAKLALPELPILFGYRPTFFAPVPETAIDKNNRPVSAKYEIRMPEYCGVPSPSDYFGISKNFHEG